MRRLVHSTSRTLADTRGENDGDAAGSMDGARMSVKDQRYGVASALCWRRSTPVLHIS